MRGAAWSIGAVCFLAGFCCVVQAEPSAPVRQLQLLSPVFDVDREYPSMTGPADTQQVAFEEGEQAELLWITGYRAEMVAADGESPMPQEFMCHSNLDFDSEHHGKLLDLPVYHTNRLFTLSQGQLAIELPAGFGLPYYSDEPFWLTTQVLNLNPDERTHQVRHRVTIDYVRDRDLNHPMRPLFMTSGWGLVLLDGEDGYFDVAEPGTEHGEGCLPGEAAAEDDRSDSFGRRFSGHWVVPPGRQVNRTLVSRIMRLPYDTSVHYIAVHLHPFAESLELIDLTAGNSIFKSRVEGFEDRIGIERVDAFSSVEGIELFADHEYELVSIYNNTTDEDQDSMAVMLLYLEDRLFEAPRETDLSSIAPDGG